MKTLYISRGSSALAAHILMEEIGAPYRIEEVPIPEGAHRSAGYLALNPKGRVPTLVDGDTVVTENPAILTYLAETHPEAGLLPQDAATRARVNEIAAYLCATVHVAFAHKQRGGRWADDPDVIAGMQVRVADNLRDCAAVIDGHCLTGPFVLGEHYSLIDPYMFLVPRWMAAAGVALDAYPRLGAHRAAMLARPATQTVLAAHGL